MKEQMDTIDSWVRDGFKEKALDALNALYKSHRDNAQVLYRLASVNDSLGNEEAAIDYYKRALSMGLSGAEERGAYLGLGSSYRWVGLHNISSDVLQEGVEKFKGNEFRVFLAVTKFDNHDYQEAFKLLLGALIDTTRDEHILEYRRALLEFSSKL